MSLLKPIDPVRLAPTVRAEEQRVTKALRKGRETGMAVGILMEGFRLDRRAALRNHARSLQCKRNEVAVE
jgi:response regulator NasT